MGTSVKILAGVAVLVAFWQNCLIISQRISQQDFTCNDTEICPCCSVPCPSDGTGLCGGNCKDGYHGGKCYNRCPDNCIRCVDAQHGNGVSNCTLCKDGYFSTRSMYQCQLECSFNCKTCGSRELCTLCKEGYYSNSSQKLCQSICTSNCKTCESSASKCTSCNSTLYINESNQCAECIEPCETCTSLTNCTSCKRGFYNVNTIGTECNKCNSLCYACNSSETCFCSNGCNSASGSSVEVNCNITTNKCAFGCKSNNFTSTYTNDTCDKCKDGNYGIECDLQCPMNCQPTGCNRSNGVCHSCNDGFLGDYCIQSCPGNCGNSKKCNMSTGHCISCNHGFYGSNCSVKCTKNCIRCDQTNGSCTRCTEDRLYGRNCTELCPPNCKDGKCNITGHCDIVSTTTLSTTTTVLSVVPQESSSLVGPVTGGTVPALLLVTTVVVLAVFYFRRRSVSSFKGNFNVIQLEEYNLSQTDILEENNEFDPTYFTCKTVGKKKPCGKLPVLALTQFVETHGVDFYQEEFLKLPRGLIKPCDDAKLKENIIKNRYTGIYPYDEHRVKLLPPGSDFINACYIDGFKTKKEYISSLGPTRKAMEGFQLFWRMVWQEKTDIIVMVTNLMEGQSMKCEQYWPEVGSSLRYGNINVTLHSEGVYSEFVVRKMSLSVGSENRSLNHLHYTAWPDKQVPDEITSLIEFRQKVKATESFHGGPIIVHCSAGIGRTGTYIAMDILIHQGKAQKSLDIFEWVTRMREQRTSMVQTWQQYEFLHRALVHALTFHCDPIKETKFPQFMDSLTDKRLKKLFKIMSTPEKPGDGEEEARTINRGYDGLNREGADIPGSLNRPLLHLEKKFGECNYINAVYINSYTTKGRFLVCQTPLPDTVKDFLTLIIQESCSCIVSMDPPGLKDPTIGEYFSRTDNETFILPSGLYEVETLELDKNPSYILRKLTIQHNQRSESVAKTVYHYQCHHWPYGNRIPDVSYFLQLVQDVDAMAERNSDHGPVLVHCLNAAERSGLYCAVSNLVQKMGVEGEVSVVNTLRQVKVRRPLTIPNKEQILVCYRAIQQFLNLRKNEESVRETAIYCNV